MWKGNHSNKKSNMENKHRNTASIKRKASSPLALKGMILKPASSKRVRRETVRCWDNSTTNLIPMF